MQELDHILTLAAEAATRGVSAVLATVVRIEGSGYRRPGARLLLCPDGGRAGSISGGCLEGDVAKKAWWRTENGPAVVRYDTGPNADGEWSFGLGCNGVIDVLLERIEPDRTPGYLAVLRRNLQRRQSVVLARIVAGDAVGGWLTRSGDEIVHNLKDQPFADTVAQTAAEVQAAGVSRHVRLGGVELFAEMIRPPLALTVCGAGADAVPVVNLARQLGWHVTVCDPRSTVPPLSRFPLADAVLAASPENFAPNALLEPTGAAVVMSHNRADDRRFLKALLPSPVGYIGVLGPRRRTHELLEELKNEGMILTAGQAARLHAPVGLDLGGDAPADVALAIVAEVRAALSHRGGGFLRDQPGPIHRREVGS